MAHTLQVAWTVSVWGICWIRKGAGNTGQALQAIPLCSTDIPAGSTLLQGSLRGMALHSVWNLIFIQISYITAPNLHDAKYFSFKKSTVYHTYCLRPLKTMLYFAEMKSTKGPCQCDLGKIVLIPTQGPAQPCIWVPLMRRELEQTHKNPPWLYIISGCKVLKRTCCISWLDGVLIAKNTCLSGCWGVWRTRRKTCFGRCTKEIINMNKVWFSVVTEGKGTVGTPHLWK